MFTLSDDPTSKDYITAHRLTLLILIKNYADIYNGKNDDYPRLIWQDEWSSKHHLDRLLLSWVRQPDGSFKDILKTVGLCSKVLFNAFTHMLEAICLHGNIENLENFMSNLGFGLFEESESVLQKRGLLGMFCRRMLVYYERLSYCEVHPLLEKLIKYCSPLISMKKSKLRRPSIDDSNHDYFEVPPDKDMISSDIDVDLESQSEMDSKSSRDSIENTVDLKPSDLKTDKCENFDSAEYFKNQRQAEYFFSQQASLMEMRESEVLSPPVLQKKIRDLLKNNPELTLAHYVSYLNNLRVKEFCGAMDSLFMYSVRNNSRPPDNLFKSDDEAHKSKTCRYAALHLALLHQRFGHKKAALAAVKEAISLAQLSNDSVCLQHAMSFLHHLEEDASKQKVLEEIIKPAKKHNLLELAYSAIHKDMRRSAVNGKRPAVVLRSLAAADALCCNQALHAGSVTASYAHKASLWRLYGKRQMALLSCQQVLSTQPVSDKKSTLKMNPSTPEDTVLAYSHLVELLHEEGMNGAANDVIAHLRVRFPSSSRFYQTWRKTEMRLLHTNSIRLNKVTDSINAVNTLLSIDRTEALFRQAESLAISNEKLQAHSILDRLLQEENESKLTAELKCKIYILLGQLHVQRVSDKGSSFKYFTDALAIARDNYMNHLVTECILKVAQLHIHSNSAAVGFHCLSLISKEILTNGSVDSRCKHVLAVVQASMKMLLNNHQKEVDNMITYLEPTTDVLQSSQDIWRKRDTVYWLARLYHDRSSFFSDSEKASGDCSESIRRRNELASEFKRLDVQLASANCQLVM